MAGVLELSRARVRWFLSVDPSDLPLVPLTDGAMTHRSIIVDDDEVEFTGGFTDLHTRLYEETLAGRGFGLHDARPSIELAYRIRQEPLSPAEEWMHQLVGKSRG